MSHGDYQKVKRKIIKANLKKMEEAKKSDPSIVVQTPPPPPRHRKWKEARMKGGKFLNLVIEEIAAKIVSS